MKIFIFLVLCICQGCCSFHTHFTIYTQVPETAVHFNIKSIEPETPRVIKGQPIQSLKWTDKNGENLFILSQTGKMPGKGNENSSAELYAYLYRITGKDTILIRRVYDYENDCPFDLYVGFLDSSLTITDLDADGIGEITILYKLSCRSDVEPARMKLIMLEGDQKYALRGRMMNTFVEQLPDDERMEMINEYGWGRYTIDKAFEKAPREFLKFAIQRWESLKSQDYFIQMD